MPSQLQRSEPNVLFYPLFQKHLVEAERRELERRAFDEECSLAVAAHLSRSPGGGQSPANLSFGSPNPLNSECAVIYSPMPEAAPSSSFLSVFGPLKTVFRASVPTTSSYRATHPTPTAGPPPVQSIAGHSTTQPELNYSSSSSSSASTSLHDHSHGPSPQLERHLTVVFESQEGKPDAHTNTSSNPSTSDRVHRSLPPSTEGTQPMDGSSAAAMPSMHSNNSSFAGAVAMVSSMAARLHQQMPWGGVTSGGHQRVYVSETATIYGSGTGTAVFNSTPAKALTVPKTPYELVADLLHAHPQLQAYFTLPECAISSPASLGAAFFANKLDSTIGEETGVDKVDESESVTDESECFAAPHFVGISPMLHGCEDRCLFETPLWRNPALTVPPSNLGLLVNLRDPTHIPIKFLKSNGSKAYDWARAAKFSAAPMSDSAGLSEAQVFHCLLELRPFSRKSTRLNQAKGVDDKDGNDGASLRRLATVLNRGGPTKKVEGYGATENTDHQPKKQQRRQPNDNADIITLGDSEGEFSSNGSVASSSSVNKTNERTSVAQSDTSEYLGISIKEKGDGGYTSSSDDDQPVPLHAFKGDVSEAAVMRVDLPIPSYPTLALPCHAVGASVSCSSSQLLSVGYTPVISDYFASLPAYPVVELVRQQFAKSPWLSLSDALGGLPLHDRTLSAAEASAVLGGSLSLRSPTSPMPPAARRQHQLDSVQHQPSSPVAPQPTGVLARLKSFSEFFAPPPGINDRQKSYEQLSPHNRAPLRSNTKTLLSSSPAKDKDRQRQPEEDARKALAQARTARREWRKTQLYRLHRKPPPPPQIMIMKYYNTEAVDSPNMLIRFTRHVTATTADVFAMREMKFYELLAPLFAENSLYFSPHQMLKDGTPSPGGHGHWDSVNRSLSAQQVNNATSPNKEVDDGFGTAGVGCGGATIKDAVRRRMHTLHQQRQLEEQVRMEQFEDEVAARNQSGSLISPNDTVHHDWQGRQHTDLPFASISHQTNYMDPEVNAYSNPKNYNERSASTMWGSGYLNLSPSHKPEVSAAYISLTSPHDAAILDSTPKASRDATPSQKRQQITIHNEAPITVDNNSLFGIVQPRWPSTDVISDTSVAKELPVPSHQVVTIAAYTSEVTSSSSSSAVSFTSGNELKPKRNRTVLGRILKQFGLRSRRKAAQMMGNNLKIPPTALKFESEVDMSKQLRPGGQPHLRTMKTLAKGSARIKRFNSISFAKTSMHREEAVPLTMSDSSALPPPPDASLTTRYPSPPPMSVVSDERHQRRRLTDTPPIVPLRDMAAGDPTSFVNNSGLHNSPHFERVNQSPPRSGKYSDDVNTPNDGHLANSRLRRVAGPPHPLDPITSGPKSIVRRPSAPSSPAMYPGDTLNQSIGTNAGKVEANPARQRVSQTNRAPRRYDHRSHEEGNLRCPFRVPSVYFLAAHDKGLPSLLKYVCCSEGSGTVVAIGLEDMKKAGYNFDHTSPSEATYMWKGKKILESSAVAVNATGASPTAPLDLVTEIQKQKRCIDAAQPFDAEGLGVVSPTSDNGKLLSADSPLLLSPSNTLTQTENLKSSLHKLHPLFCPDTFAFRSPLKRDVPGLHSERQMCAVVRGLAYLHSIMWGRCGEPVIRSELDVATIPRLIHRAVDESSPSASQNATATQLLKMGFNKNLRSVRNLREHLQKWFTYEPSQIFLLPQIQNSIMFTQVRWEEIREEALLIVNSRETVVHGDAHYKNCGFKNLPPGVKVFGGGGKNSAKEPLAPANPFLQYNEDDQLVQACFLDFQSCGGGSVAAELLYFICTSCPVEVVEEDSIPDLLTLFKATKNKGKRKAQLADQQSRGDRGSYLDEDEGGTKSVAQNYNSSLKGVPERNTFASSVSVQDMSLTNNDALLYHVHYLTESQAPLPQASHTSHMLPTPKPSTLAIPVAKPTTLTAPPTSNSQLCPSPNTPWNNTNRSALPDADPLAATGGSGVVHIGLLPVSQSHPHQPNGGADDSVLSTEGGFVAQGANNGGALVSFSPQNTEQLPYAGASESYLGSGAKSSSAAKQSVSAVSLAVKTKAPTISVSLVPTTHMLTLDRQRAAKSEMASGHISTPGGETPVPSPNNLHNPSTSLPSTSSTAKADVRLSLSELYIYDNAIIDYYYECLMDGPKEGYIPSAASVFSDSPFVTGAKGLEVVAHQSTRSNAIDDSTQKISQVISPHPAAKPSGTDRAKINMTKERLIREVYLLARHWAGCMLFDLAASNPSDRGKLKKLRAFHDLIEWGERTSKRVFLMAASVYENVDKHVEAFDANCEEALRAATLMNRQRIAAEAQQQALKDHRRKESSISPSFPNNLNAAKMPLTHSSSTVEGSNINTPTGTATAKPTPTKR